MDMQENIIKNKQTKFDDIKLQIIMIMSFAWSVVLMILPTIIVQSLQVN